MAMKDDKSDLKLPHEIDERNQTGKNYNTWLFEVFIRIGGKNKRVKTQTLEV